MSGLLVLCFDFADGGEVVIRVKYYYCGVSSIVV